MKIFDLDLDLSLQITRDFGLTISTYVVSTWHAKSIGHHPEPRPIRDKERDGKQSWDGHQAFPYMAPYYPLGLSP